MKRILRYRIALNHRRNKMGGYESITPTFALEELITVNFVCSHYPRFHYEYIAMSFSKRVAPFMWLPDNWGIVFPGNLDFLGPKSFLLIGEWRGSELTGSDVTNLLLVVVCQRCSPSYVRNFWPNESHMQSSAILWQLSYDIILSADVFH